MGHFGEIVLGSAGIIPDNTGRYVPCPEVLTEAELIRYLRIPQVSNAGNFRNVVGNLKRIHGLPCIHISKQPLYPLETVRQWLREKATKEQCPNISISSPSDPGYTGTGSVLPAKAKKGGQIMKKELVRLRHRPSRDGRSFNYFLDYVESGGKRRRISLGYADKHKAERQRVKIERELKMGVIAPESMRLSEFVADSLRKTGDQIRESTRREYVATMQDFIAVVGDKDYQKVTLNDGEFYRQHCLDQGNSPATVSKKLREVKSIFQLAVKRRQLEVNPLAYIAKPKCPKTEIHTYTDDECRHMVKAAGESAQEVRWDLLILVALCTGLRRGELLNCLWSNIDFGEHTITVTAKDDTAETWKWLIKDSDSRTVPLTEDLTQMLVEHQARHPEGYPYAFVPPTRYDCIQKLRADGKWTYCDSRTKVIARFNRTFLAIIKRAGIKHGTFHDLRRTAICNWFREGLSELEVMKLAGHTSFATTHKYYLKVDDDSVDRARRASAQAMSRSGTLWHAPGSWSDIQGEVAIASDCQANTCGSGQGRG
jgi:integrase